MKPALNLLYTTRVASRRQQGGDVLNAPAQNTRRRALWLILALALILRLIAGLSLDPLAPYAARGADSSWYLPNAKSLFVGDALRCESGDPLWQSIPPEHFLGYRLTFRPHIDCERTHVSHLTPPPVYFIVLGIPQAILSPAAAVTAVRVFQALLGAATCYFAYRMARRLAGERAGLVAAGILAVHPTFILENAQIATETVFVCFIAAGLAFYLDALASARRNLALIALAGALLGAATLTRAVSLLFPLGLAFHLCMVYGLRGGLKRGLALIAVYALVVSTWTVYNLARWDRFVLAGEGLPAFLYIGAAGWDTPQELDRQIAEELGVTADEGGGRLDYLEAAENRITGDPIGYVRYRLTDLAGAYLQPHSTTLFPGESLRDLSLAWLRDDRSLSGLATLVQEDYFIPKLVLYVFHFGGLILGAVGMWITRRAWRFSLPLIGYIAYTTLVHLLLLALPRYLFPMLVLWWVFAGTALDKAFIVKSEQLTVSSSQ